jgi:hypothetical protein
MTAMTSSSSSTSLVEAFVLRPRQGRPRLAGASSARAAGVLRPAAALLLVAVLAAACGDDPAVVAPAPDPSTTTTSVVPPPAPTATTSAPTTTTPTTVAPAWVVGASPLPLRPDGFGEVLPTPEVLVDRRLPTVDVLPPPASGGFEASVSAIDEVIRARMGGTLRDGCPVGVDDLRYLTVSFRGFDGAAHTGELVIHRDEADDVVSVFHQLFDAGFPIEEMRLVTDADLEAPPTGDGNVTAAFVCRPVRGGTRFSAHASGLAIDLDPFQNPYQRDDLVLPELASAYLDRSVVRPGMILDGGVAVAAFEAIGWTWGGRWDDPVDRMHFSATGG